MADHIHEWLGAYHDGELRGARLRKVEGHLAACAECRAELEQIRMLSDLLQNSEPAGEFLPTERFVANLNLRLPRQPQQSQPPFKAGWWSLPLVLLGIWLFIDITFSLSWAASLAANTGLLGSDLTWLRGNPPQMGWFAAAMNLLRDQPLPLLWEFLSGLNQANVFITRLLRTLVPQLLLAAAYLGWLFSWWLRQQQEPS